VLTPLAVDPSRPFPYISGLSLNLAVIVRNPKKKEESFARVKIPTNLPRFISTTNNSDTRYIPIEQVIAANLPELFPGMEIIDQFTFRLTRNADLELEEDDVENLISSMEQELQRRKFGPPVRLEVEKGIDVESLDTLIEELDINREEVISVENLIDFTSLHYFADFEIPEARYPKFKSTSHPLLGDPDEDNPEKIFAAMRGQEMQGQQNEAVNKGVMGFGLEMQGQANPLLGMKGNNFFNEQGYLQNVRQFDEEMKQRKSENSSGFLNQILGLGGGLASMFLPGLGGGSPYGGGGWNSFNGRRG
jgi:hypothetical protein